MDCCNCHYGGWAIVKLLRSRSVRKPEEMAKKATVLRDASCMKEWFISWFLNGPLLTSMALGRVDLQWGSGVGECAWLESKTHLRLVGWCSWLWSPVDWNGLIAWGGWWGRRIWLVIWSALRWCFDWDSSKDGGECDRFLWWGDVVSCAFRRICGGV